MATRSLGSLSGSAREPIDLDFEWFGATIKVSPDASDLAMIDFLAEAGSIPEGDAVAVMLAVYKHLQVQIHEDDWVNFVRLAKKNRQTYIDLLRVSKDLVVAIAGFPTTRLLASAGGQSNIGTSSAPITPQVRSVMASLANRPDLMVLVWRAQQARLQEAAGAVN